MLHNSEVLEIEKNELEIKQFNLEIKDEKVEKQTKLPKWYKPISVSPAGGKNKIMD